MNPSKVDPAWYAERGRNPRVRKRERKRQRAVGILKALAGQRGPSRAEQARKLYDLLGIPDAADPNKVMDWYEYQMADQAMKKNPPFLAASPQPYTNPFKGITVPNTGGGIETGWSSGTIPNGTVPYGWGKPAPNSGGMYYSETQHHSASYHAASQTNSP